jgi:hypothetical protein
MGGSPRAEDDGSGRILRVNADGLVCAQGGGAAGTAGRRQAVQGRATRAARRGVAPFIGARGAKAAWPACRGAAPCAAGGRAQMDLAGLAGRARAGWVEPWARPNPVDRFCFFSFFF